MKTLKNFRLIRRDIKHQALKDEYIKQIQEVLNLFDNKENKYSHEIVLFACQVAEQYFISHKGLGKFKLDAVVQATKKYFNDDEELVIKIVELVFDKIEKSNIFRRNKTRLYNFFFTVLSIWEKKY